MRQVLRWVAAHPAPTGIVVLLVTIAFALALPRLRIDESAEGLMVRHDPAREFYEQAKRRFGSDNLTVVLIKADDVFAPGVLAVVQRLSESLARVEHVSRVESLTTVRNIKGEGDVLNTERLVDPLPRTVEEATRIRRDALDNRVFVGNLVARDGRATAVTVYADPPAGDGAFNTRFVTAWGSGSTQGPDRRRPAHGIMAAEESHTCRLTLRPHNSRWIRRVCIVKRYSPIAG